MLNHCKNIIHVFLTDTCQEIDTYQLFFSCSYLWEPIRKNGWIPARSVLLVILNIVTVYRHFTANINATSETVSLILHANIFTQSAREVFFFFLVCYRNTF